MLIKFWFFAAEDECWANCVVNGHKLLKNYK